MIHFISLQLVLTPLQNKCFFFAFQVKLLKYQRVLCIQENIIFMIS